MPTKKFEAAPEFFGNPDGISSLALAKKAGIRYADPPDGSELFPLVVSGSPPAPSKVKTSFGHQVTKANAKAPRCFDSILFVSSGQLDPTQGRDG